MYHKDLILVSKENVGRYLITIRLRMVKLRHAQAD